MKFSRQAVLVAASLLATIAVTPTLVEADDRPPAGNNANDNGKDKNRNEHGKEERGNRDRGNGAGPPGQQWQKGEKNRDFGTKREPSDRQNKQFGNGGAGGNPNASGNTQQPERHKKQFGEQPSGNPNAPGNAQQPERHKKQFGEQPSGNPNAPGNAQQQPSFQKKQFGNEPAGNPDTFGKTQLPERHKKQFGQQPSGNPSASGNAEQQPSFQKKQFGNQPSGVPNSKSGIPDNQIGGASGDQDRSKFQKKFGGQDRDRGTNPPVVVNPQPLDRPATTNVFVPNKPLSAADAKKRFENMRGARKQVTIDGGKGVVIEEPGKRRIFKENNRIAIQHDENDRLRRVNPNARFEKGKGGMNVSVIDRPGGYKVYSETDANGQLLRRYRRGPDGRDVIIIDNRRRRGGYGRDVAAGIGIGIGVLAGAAILDSVLDVPEPRVRIPREQYIVDYDRASDDDVYEALSAPPVEEFDDRYTLDEIRATASLRDRMRRIDLDDITFEFGSWDVDPSQYGRLERIARAMRRVIDRNPNEVFMIEGYTDAVGTPEDNLSLSDRRAESVAEVLTQQFQIPFENLTTQGYGEQYLKVPTDGPERLNRRVAVRRITPLLARDGGPPPPADADRPPADDQSGGPGGPDDNGPDGGPDDGGPGGNGPPPPRGSGSPQD